MGIIQKRPNYIFEVSWEVCNKVGGIYTVLSTRANTLQMDQNDRDIFIGPYLNNDEQHSLFSEDNNLLSSWRFAAAQEGMKVHIGRWNVLGNPIAILIDFEFMYADKNEVYTKMWEWYHVNSIKGYGDYDESSMFSVAAGKFVEIVYNSFLYKENEVIYQAHEWMTGMGLLYIKKKVPSIATIFTTHATSIGRSITSNNKPLYAYFEGYNGDQMAEELNMTAKHSIEKVTAHNADCFTTVSDFTAKECTQLLEKTPDIVLPNGFNNDFVPKGKEFTDHRRIARKQILKVASNLMGREFDKNTMIIATSGRNDFRCKGVDVFIDTLVEFNKCASIDQDLLAVIQIPCWMKQCRADLLERINSTKKYTNPLDNPYITHELHDMSSDRILNLLKSKGLVNAENDKVKVMFVPCYLDGNDGIFNLNYYDLLIGNDLSLYPSYYEPWGYTPLESIAFRVPCVTTDLSGFGQWVNTLNIDTTSIMDGVSVVHRNDENYNDTVLEMKEIILTYMQLTTRQRTIVRNKAKKIADKASWSRFIKYYYYAYDIALNNAEKRIKL